MATGVLVCPSATLPRQNVNHLRAFGADDMALSFCATRHGLFSVIVHRPYRRVSDRFQPCEHGGFTGSGEFGESDVLLIADIFLATPG